MAWHWVQAIGTVMRMRDGNREVYRPGDWLQVQSRDLLRYQAEGKGYSFVEVLSMCPTGWGVEPREGAAWVGEAMVPWFPLGTLRDRGGPA